MLSDAFHLLTELNPSKGYAQINAEDPEAEAIVRRFMVEQLKKLRREFDGHHIWTNTEINTLLDKKAREIYGRAADLYPNRIYREREDRPFATKFEKYVLPTFKDED